MHFVTAAPNEQTSDLVEDSLGLLNDTAGL